MRGLHAARIAVAGALLLLGLMSGTLAYTAEASGGGTIIVTPPSCGGASENDSSGPSIASEQSDGKSEEGAPGLCQAMDRSGGRSPAPVSEDVTCAGVGADTITIQSHRGFGWVC